MTTLSNAGWAILSWLASILAVIGWPLQFVGDLLCLPTKWVTRKFKEQDLEELKRAYGSLLVALPERDSPPPEKAN